VLVFNFFSFGIANVWKMFLKMCVNPAYAMRKYFDLCLHILLEHINTSRIASIDHFKYNHRKYSEGDRSRAGVAARGPQN